MIESLEKSKEFLIERCPQFPKVVITLGSGLGNLISEMELEREIPFSDIPHFKSTTVPGHSGKVVIGSLSKVRVVCLQGRLHFYEGYSMQDVVFPFRVLGLCGAEVFLLTNASGGVHPDMHPGQLVLLSDHINLMGSNPLIGKNIEKLGSRFPDMSHVYDPYLRRALLEVAKKQNVALREGVYAAVHGPSYETPAEVRMLRELGADLIGMSTVPEAIALNHMGKKVVGLSCVTNLAAGVGQGVLNHEEVLQSAKLAESSMAKLVKEFIHVLHR